MLITLVEYFFLLVGWVECVQIGETVIGSVVIVQFCQNTGYFHIHGWQDLPVPFVYSRVALCVLLYVWL